MGNPRDRCRRGRRKSQQNSAQESWIFRPWRRKSQGWMVNETARVRKDPFVRYTMSLLRLCKNQGGGNYIMWVAAIEGL